MNEQSKHNIKIIAGSVRPNRFSIKAAKWMESILTKREDVAVELLDLNDYEMPFFNEVESPASKSAPYKDEVVSSFTKKIEEADAFVIVTPEYNHGTSGVLKNALDWVYPEWNQKPVAFVGYGNASGARAIEQLRLVAIELQMAPIREAVHISGEKFFPVQFGDASADEMFESLNEKADKMVEQLLWWSEVLKKGREG